jgi:hypothetical protein
MIGLLPNMPLEVLGERNLAGRYPRKQASQKLQLKGVGPSEKQNRN